MLNICFICDKNYVLVTKTAINSLVKTQKEALKIYVIGVELSDENAQQFYQFANENVTINVIRQDNIFKNMDCNHPYITSAVFFKFLIADLLPEEKVLYLDGDVIVADDIADFYHIDLTDCYAAVAKDLVIEYEDIATKKLNPKGYFNAGVMLLNLQKIRNDKAYDQANKYILDNNNLKYMEQDALNVFWQDYLIYVAVQWNYFSLYETKNYDELKNTAAKKIIHYAGCKPWNSLNNPLSELWLKYILPEDFGIVLKAYFKHCDAENQHRLTNQKNEFFNEHENLKNAFENQQQKFDVLRNELSAAVKHDEVNALHAEIDALRENIDCLHGRISELEQFKAQNAVLTQQLKKLANRPRFVWRLYELVKNNEKTTLYVLGIPVFKNKNGKLYVLGIPFYKYGKGM